MRRKKIGNAPRPNPTTTQICKLSNIDPMDAESIKKSISDDGFFYIEDPECGRRANMFAAKGYPFQTIDGLDFLSAVLDNELIRDTIESSLLDNSDPKGHKDVSNASQLVRDMTEPSKRCGLGMFKVFGPHPDTARALLNRTTDERLALDVLVCRSGSKIILDKYSHIYELDAVPGGIGLLELPRESMARPGIIPVPINLKNGGLIIVDGRVFTTVVEGAAFGIRFAVEEELKEWGKMRLPKDPVLEKKVAEMETDRVRMNFHFVAVGRPK